MAYAPIRTSGGMTPAATQQVKKPASPMATQQRGIPAQPAIAKRSPFAPDQSSIQAKKFMQLKHPGAQPQFGTPVAGAMQPPAQRVASQLPQIAMQPPRDPLVQARIDAVQNQMTNGGAPIQMGMGDFNNQATVTMDPMLKLRMLMRQRQMQTQQPQAIQQY